jgi:hypothetical protein
VTAQDQQDRHGEFPPELADRLRAAARRGTDGTTPFPRVRLAVRRDRRIRAAGAATAAAALLVVATAVTGAVRSDHAAPPANRGEGPVSTTPGPDGDPYTMTGSTAGSLAGDKAWIRGMEQRLTDRGIGLGGRMREARVLLATDHDGTRYALTVGLRRVTDTSTGVRGGVWTFQGWRGRPGAAPAEMQYDETAQALAGPGVDAEGSVQYVAIRRSADRNTSPGLMVVVGRGLAGVEAGSRVTYRADGTETATWRPLRRERAVWWSAADADELTAGHVRARFSDGLRRAIVDATNDATAPPPLGMAGVAPAGTDAGTLDCAATSFDRLRGGGPRGSTSLDRVPGGGGGFPRGSTPVLGRVRRQGDVWIGVAVARAPGGAYLVGTCRTRHPEWPVDGAETAGGYVVPAPAGGPDHLLTVMPVQPGGPAPDPDAETATKLVAIAPRGATEVTFGHVTAPVQDRLAVIDLPDRTPIHGITVTARDAAGRTLGTAQVPRTDQEAEAAAFYDTRP